MQLRRRLTQHLRQDHPRPLLSLRRQPPLLTAGGQVHERRERVNAVGLVLRSEESSPLRRVAVEWRAAADGAKRRIDRVRFGADADDDVLVVPFDSAQGKDAVARKSAERRGAWLCALTRHMAGASCFAEATQDKSAPTQQGLAIDYIACGSAAMATARSLAPGGPGPGQAECRARGASRPGYWQA